MKVGMKKFNLEVCQVRIDLCLIYHHRVELVNCLPSCPSILFPHPSFYYFYSSYYYNLGIHRVVLSREHNTNYLVRPVSIYPRMVIICRSQTSPSTIYLLLTMGEVPFTNEVITPSLECKF